MVTEGGVLGGRYRLDERIGRGGFALVFRATDLVLKRRVAVKVLRPDLADPAGAAEFLARFAREAQAVAALDHPHILAVHDYGEVGGTAFLVMPYITGGTLYDRQRRGDRPGLPRIREYLRQVAAALDYAHRQGIVHRDVTAFFRGV